MITLRENIGRALGKLHERVWSYYNSLELETFCAEGLELTLHEKLLKKSPRGIAAVRAEQPLPKGTWDILQVDQNSPLSPGEEADRKAVTVVTQLRHPLFTATIPAGWIGVHAKDSTNIAENIRIGPQHGDSSVEIIREFRDHSMANQLEGLLRIKRYDVDVVEQNGHKWLKWTSPARSGHPETHWLFTYANHTAWNITTQDGPAEGSIGHETQLEQIVASIDFKQ